MKKLLLSLAFTGLAMVGCGGPHCVENEVTTCDPECDTAAGEFCNADLECVTFTPCDPACDTATEFCDGEGNCDALPASCSPACGAGEFCDDGSCTEIPVCSPACGADEHCEN